MEERNPTEEKTELLGELDQLLRNAVHDARADMVKELITLGADANCAVAGNPAVCLAAMAATVFDDDKDRLSVIEALVAGGADLSLKDSTGRTARDWLRGAQSSEILSFARKLRTPRKRK